MGFSRRRLGAWGLVAAIGLLIGVLLLGGDRKPVKSEHDAAALVVRVAWCYDGDSFRTDSDAEVRILGIDCPEKDEPFSDEARDFAVQMLSGKLVRLEGDDRSLEVDRYGRKLAYVMVDETDFGRRILHAGLALVYSGSPCGRTSRYREIEREARRGRRGLWQSR